MREQSIITLLPIFLTITRLLNYYMKKNILSACLILVLVGLGFISLQQNYQHQLNNSHTALQQCRLSANTNIACGQFTSKARILPGNPPDLTAGWTTYSLDKYFHLTFSHPTNMPVSVETGSGDVVFRRVHIGAEIIFEAVSSGPDGVAGDNPAEYERLVFNTVAQNTQPIWTNYNPGYSQEIFGNISFYHFHTNIFDMGSSGTNVLSPSAYNGIPMQGVIFDPVHGTDWLVYFNMKDEQLADNILRTVSLSK